MIAQCMHVRPRHRYETTFQSFRFVQGRGCQKCTILSRFCDICKHAGTVYWQESNHRDWIFRSYLNSFCFDFILTFSHNDTLQVFRAINSEDMYPVMLKFLSRFESKPLSKEEYLALKALVLFNCGKSFFNTCSQLIKHCFPRLF